MNIGIETIFFRIAVKRKGTHIKVFESHQESDRYEARQRSRMSKAERMKRFSKLQRRFWGTAFSEKEGVLTLKEEGFTGAREMHD